MAVGGVASTDGGVGATEAVPHPLLVPLEVACDVDARFLDAADVFAPQKGATPEQVRILRERLARLVVPDLPGAGAAGGLAGGLAAIGARLVPGFDLVAGRLGLDGTSPRPISSSPARASSTRRRSPARSSAASSNAPQAAGVEALVVAGDVATEARSTRSRSSRRYGPERALAEPAECVTELVAADPGDPPKPP